MIVRSPQDMAYLEVTQKAEAASEPLTLVANWPALLKR